MRTCLVAGCGKPAKARGLCNTCYARRMKHEQTIGTPSAADEARLLSKVSPEPTSGCWLWLGAYAANGYGEFTYGYRKEPAHRASWRILRGPPPADRFVCHRCDNPACVNPDHLFLGTARDNALDMNAKGRATTKRARGELASKAKLTADQVIEARLRHEAGERTGVLARHYGISSPAMGAILLRRNWRHV